ncbi:hypothetical protein [Kushneria aurantia]|uniref:SAM-dependent methyltransferase RsmB-F/NOP2-type catalytic core domain-containing protein n=1 Tax=Kushneria aurantia TaxID=504092 RepID=A0ABV6G3X1_9GAMM|nr:hypothetical protein [Kushneria aurantia]
MTSSHSVMPPLPAGDTAFQRPAAPRTGLFSAEEGVSLLQIEQGHRVLDMHASGRQRASRILRDIAYGGMLTANIAGAATLEMPSCYGMGGIQVDMKHIDDEALVPQQMGFFDRVLLDTRFLAGRCSASPYGFERQFRLLQRSVELCRSGGRIVYMTSSPSPEENEVVVDRVLNDSHKALAVRPARLAGVIGTPGQTRWSGQQLDPRLSMALRLYSAGCGSQSCFLTVLERLN